MILAEIYLKKTHMEDEAYFEQLLQKMNNKLPVHKRVTRVILRREEIVKNSSMKIVRYLV